MKKIIISLVLCLLFACSIFIKPKQFTLTDYFDAGILYIYTNSPVNETSIPLSNIYMTANYDKVNKKDIVGESLCFNDLEIGSAINTLKAKIKFTEYIENQNLTIIYAYSSLISTYKKINNVKVNLQISTCTEYSIIGWPVIYGSF